jgi:flavin-dependent dehydrogenase
MRPICADGFFRLGNAAGEAHQVVAEGIAMALQSAQLLCGALTARRNGGMTFASAQSAGRDYAAACRREFAFRIRAAAVFARLAMSPKATALLPLIAAFPQLLNWAAQPSGKRASRRSTDRCTAPEPVPLNTGKCRRERCSTES